MLSFLMFISKCFNFILNTTHPAAVGVLCAPEMCYFPPEQQVNALSSPMRLMFTGDPLYSPEEEVNMGLSCMLQIVWLVSVAHEGRP